MILLAFLYRKSITATSNFIEDYMAHLQNYKKNIFIKKFVAEPFTYTQTKQFEYELQHMENKNTQETINFMLNNYEMITQFIKKGSAYPTKIEESPY